MVFIADKIRLELNKKTFEQRNQEQIAESKKDYAERTLDAGKVLITNTRLIKMSRSVTVAIRVENSLDKPFGSANVMVQLFDEAGLFGECTGYLQKFDAGEIKERIIQCTNFSLDSFPENVSIRAKVMYVQKMGYGL